MNCGCPVDRKVVIYVGRAVLLRSRLQVHFYGNRSRDPAKWFEEFHSGPHNHIVFASAWFVERGQLQVAEAVLIDELRPIRNKAGFGFANPKAWIFRSPDIPCIDPVDIEPHPRRPRNIGCDSGVPNVPAVYAWWIDHGNEDRALHSLFGHLTASTP